MQRLLSVADPADLDVAAGADAAGAEARKHSQEDLLGDVVRLALGTDERRNVRNTRGS